MVDARALKIGAAVVLGAALLFFASFVLRFAARILTWAVLLLLAIAAGYVVYQLVSGWRAAGADADVDDSPADVDEVKDRYASGELSEAEFEAELEAAVDAEADAATEGERESER